jgi:hypothetical protein
MVLSDNFPSTGAVVINGLHVHLVPMKPQTSGLMLHDILILMRLAKSKHLLNKTLNHETPLHIFRQLLKTGYPAHPTKPALHRPTKQGRFPKSLTSRGK